MDKRARKILNIITAVVMVAIAVLLLVLITTLIVRNLSGKADNGAATDVRTQVTDTTAPQSPENVTGGAPGAADPDAGPTKADTVDLPEKDNNIKSGQGAGSGEEAPPMPGRPDEESDKPGAGDTEQVDTSAEDAESPDDAKDTEDAEAAENPQDNTALRHDDIQLSIDSIAAKYGAVGVQVAVIRNGEVSDTYVYGDAVRGSRQMTDDTKIRVASVSKVVLTMAIMRLRELGQIDIDADIGDYWGFNIRNPNHADIPITIRQIMSHTSSMIVYEYGFSAGGQLVRSRFQDGSCFVRSTPGDISAWDYNNYAFAALGLTVEIALDETVNSIAERYLFSPLGIDAAFGGGSISDTGNIATLYTNGGGVGRSADTQRNTLGNSYPGERGEDFPGGLTISAYDLAKLIAALAGDGQYGGVRILSSESVGMMESSQGRTGGFDQCLTLRRKANLYGREELFYHTGSNYGAFNLISYDPVSGDGVVVLTSGASGSTDTNGIYAICGEITEYIYRNT